jgi:hypothetical protein
MMRAIHFAEVYEYGNAQIYVELANGHQFVHRTDDGIFVDDKALIRRREFHKRVWLEAHDNYYKITEYINENRLGKLLRRHLGGCKSSWGVFMNMPLFSPAFQDTGLLSYKVPEKLWSFWRFTTVLIRALERKELQREQAIYARLPNRDRYEEICKERGCTR